MQPAETIRVDSTQVSCDGGDGALGHPLVWLEMGAADHIDCPYCGRRFVLNEGAAAHAAH
ncbi:MAG: zinc-finger domain-containing protein [Alphaproteobacteria bacterium]